MRDDDLTWRRRTLLRVVAIALALGVVGLPTSPATADPISPAPTPTITGDPRPGQNLFISPGEWPDGTTLSYEWLLDGVTEPGANGPAWTVRQADIDVSFQVAVTGSRVGFDDVRTVSAPVTILGEQQLLRPTPLVPDSPRFGDRLTAVPGAWDTGTTQTYAWLRSGSPIAGATGTSYTPTLDDLGSRLSFQVISTAPGFSRVVRTSAPTAAVGLGALPAATATVTGAAQVGRQLDAAVAGWDSTVSVTCQWLRSGTPIDGATGTSYTVTVADLGSAISVRATGSAAGFSAASITSAPTAGVAAADVAATGIDATGVDATGVDAAAQSLGTVRISGAPKVGRTLRARTAGFDAGTTMSYRWLVGGKVRGTSRSLRLTRKMTGRRVVLQVVVTRTGYQTLTVTSKATGKVTPVRKPGKKR